MNQTNIEGKEESIVSVLLFRYLPYWPLFLMLVVLSVAGAWLYLQYTTPLYQSYTSVLLKDDKKGANESGVEEALNIFSSKKIVENEIEVIRSIRLMNEVVKQLDLYAPVFEKGKFKEISAYTTSPIKVRAKNPDDIVNKNYLEFTYTRENQVRLNGNTYSLDQWVKTPYGELMFVKNDRQTDQPTYPLFFHLINPRKVAGAVSARINVTPASRTSTVVYLTIKDEVPLRGEDILNKVAENFARFSVEEKNKIALNTLSFVENRLYAVEKELDSLESRIQNFRSTKGVVNLSEQSRLTLENVGINDRKVADINLKLAVLNEVEKYVTSKNSSLGIVPSTVGVEDPALSQLVQRLYNAELDYEKLRKTTAENNPLIIPLAKEIEQIRPQIIESIKNQRNSLLASKNNVSNTGAIYNSLLNSIPQKERELADISRQQAIKNNVYSFLLQKREQTALTLSSNVADSKIIDNAMSSGSPVSPKSLYIYVGALIGAIILGILLISVKEILNRKILFRSDIENLTTLPVIAEISKVNKKDLLLHQDEKFSLTAEQFRQLRAAIGLYGKRVHQKRLLITSSISGEGKSFISINLALSLCLSGKKVLLIDLDIRNPKVSSVMEMSDEPGIVEYLLGTKAPYEIVNQTKFSNLYFISAGGEADNAVELILTGKLDELLTSLQDEFDLIVMDTSPIDPVSDSYVFSDYCDTTLFVVRHGYTPKTMVQYFDNNSKVKALKNPLIVFNGVRSRGFLNSTYGYGYGYGYANVYRGKEKKSKKRKSII